MSDDDDDLFEDSDDTDELIAESSKQVAKKSQGLFDSDSDDEPSKPQSKRERLEALAKKRKVRDAPAERRQKKESKPKNVTEEGYESEESFDSATFQRTKEDDDFLDTTGEDADAVQELYADQHFDDAGELKEKPKKRKGRNEDADVDGEPENPIMAAVHRMKKKKREKKSFTEMDEEVKTFLGRMELAADQDEQAIEERRPATKKISMLNEVVENMTRKDTQRMLLDHDLLVSLKRWIQPLSNGQLGNVTIRQRIIDTIATMNGETGITANDLKRSDFGKVTMVLYKHPLETPAMKRRLKALIEQWSRPIFQKSGNMRDLQRVSMTRGQTGLTALSRQQQIMQPQGAGQAKAEQDLDSLITSGKKSGIESGINRVRVPFSKGFAYTVRPQAKSSMMEDKRMARPGASGDTRDKLSKRMLEKSRPSGKNQRSANISVEGRPTKG